MRRISPTTFQIARRGTSREINRQIALNLVRSRQPISRADLARLMGVRRGAVSRLVKDLLRAKQVFEGAKGESKRGRKPRHLYIETRRRCALAVDISASRTLMLVTDTLGHPLLDIQEFPTRRPAHGLVKNLAGNIGTLLSAHPEFGECLGVGIVVAGLVDLERGRLRNAPTLGWRDVDLQEPLRAAIGLPVVVENDVKMYLAQINKVSPVDKGVFGSFNLQDEHDKVQGLFTGIKVFSWMVAIGTIFAGAVGVGNIMLIVVKERTREIGLRKALGATPASIVAMIMQESVFITAVAGYSGLVMATLLLETIASALNAAGGRAGFLGPPEIEFRTAMTALIVLVVCGLLASLMPAAKAAAVNPIIALQDE